MPLDPITAVAGPESSFGTNLQNPTSSASGIYGFINSTWQANLRASGLGDPSVYPTAKSAPPSLQTAVFAWTYNSRGFSDWTCPGCDAVLTQEIANAGGPSAYAAPGSLSTNPADYAALDAPGGLQAYFSSHDGGSYVGSAPILSDGSTTPNATPNNSATSKPFSAAYTMMIDGTADQVNTVMQKVAELAYGPLSYLLIISIAIAGLKTARGKMDVQSLGEHLFRCLLVASFVSPSSSLYSNYVQGIILGLPTYFGAGFGIKGGGPMAVFDEAYNVLWAISVAINANTPISFSPSTFGSGFGTVLLADVYYVAGVIFLWIIAGVFIGAIFILIIMMILARVAILAVLFRVFDRWLIGYVDVVASLAMIMLAADILVALFQAHIIQVLGGLTLTGNPDKDLPPFGGVAGQLFLMAIGVVFSAVVIYRAHGGGTGLAFSSAFGFAGRQAQRVLGR